MAADVAEFLRNKFLTSLTEAESELSGLFVIGERLSGPVLISYFQEIKVIVETIETQSLSEKYYRRFVSVLLDLTEALTECLVFANEGNTHTQKSPFNPLTNVWFILKMKKRLAAIKPRFADFAKKEDQIDKSRESSHPDQLNFQSDPRVVGFDEQAKKIKGLLFGSSSRAGFAAIGIVGMAGSGKTTLVEEVRNMCPEFSPKIWLCLSDIIKENKEQAERIGVSIVKYMLKHVMDDVIFQEKENTLSYSSSDGLLVELLERLNHVLSGKRYLIVLDDVWHMNDFYSDLGMVHQEGDEKIREHRLSDGLPMDSGGAVIVTSRIPKVVQAMVPVGSDQDLNNSIIPLEPLDVKNCLCIFKHTFWDRMLALGYPQILKKVKLEIEIEDEFYGLPLAVKTLAVIGAQKFQRFDSLLLGIYRIPDELLTPNLYVEPGSFLIPEGPVLVFIDMKDNKLGEELLSELCKVLNSNKQFKQVYAVLEENSDSIEKGKTDNPEMVLKHVYTTLENLDLAGFHSSASQIQQNMRIIVFGRDAIVNWILGVICDLKLPISPPIAPLPLELNKASVPASFGWEELDIESMQLLLEDVKWPKPMKTDSWHILIRMKGIQSSTTQQGRPYSLYHVGDAKKADNPTFSGGFWNCFSLDISSKLEDVAPHTTQGLATLRSSETGTLTSVAKVKVLNHSGQWETFNIPSRIKSIRCLNLLSFLSELDPGGTDDKVQERTNFPPSFIDDGRLEVIGYDFFPRSDCFLQVRGIRFEFVESAAEFVNMTIDGAPWKNVPLDALIEIEISYNGQVNILAHPDCAAESIRHSSQPRAFGTGNNAKDYSKGRRMFGAASPFQSRYDAKYESDAPTSRPIAHMLS